MPRSVRSRRRQRATSSPGVARLLAVDLFGCGAGKAAGILAPTPWGPYVSKYRALVWSGGVIVGSDAEIFVFDYDQYRGVVVPALVDLLRTGEVVAWLGELFRSAQSMGEYGYDVLWPRLRERPTDLARYCTWLGDDLRYLGGQQVDRSRSELVTCPSLACPERARCLFHQDGDRNAVEQLNALHEALVATRCLGPSQFLGRSVTPNRYEPVLERQNVPVGDPVRALLAALGTRGAALGYQFETTSGIYGWLTVDETADLARRLDRLHLPRYEPTFAAMVNWWKAGEFTDNEWPDVSLSFVRTVATVAAGREQAVLWGGDVCPDVWRETFGASDSRTSS